MIQSPRHQTGFSLIELLLALGVGVLVMAAAFAAYSGRRSDAEVNVLDADINALIYKANMAYLNNNEYMQGTALITGQRLVDAVGPLPNAFIPDAGMTSGFRHFWGGQATISAASTDGGATRDLLTITLADVNADVCIDLVGRLAPRMYDTRVDGNLVGMRPERTALRQGRSDIRVEQVAPLCDGNNQLVFRYLKPLDYTRFRSLPVTASFTPGETPGSDEEIAIADNFARIEAALAARETAQLALP